LGIDDTRFVALTIHPLINKPGLLSGIEASIRAFETGELAIGNLPGNASVQLFLGSGYLGILADGTSNFAGL